MSLNNNIEITVYPHLISSCVNSDELLGVVVVVVVVVVTVEKNALH